MRRLQIWNIVKYKYASIPIRSQVQVCQYSDQKSSSVGSQLSTCFSYQHYVFQLSTLLNYGSFRKEAVDCARAFLPVLFQDARLKLLVLSLLL